MLKFIINKYAKHKIVLLIYCRIELADIIIVVVDTKANIQSVKDEGMEKFINKHIKEQLEVNLEKPKSTIEFDEWISNKEIIISMNKKDLLNDNELNILNNGSMNCGGKYFSVNKISCVDHLVEQDDIDELLKDLKIKVSGL